MQIIIPMSGTGERFKQAGYQMPKPLIEIDGVPLIDYVVDMFPGEENIIFVCNREHLDNPNYRMREILLRRCPTARIVSIEPHKLGPVHAALQAEGLIDLSEPTIVCYCDFTCRWDYAAFKQMTADTQCDGAVVCYTGFHPHMLGSVNYAYIQHKAGWISAIQEKQPYTDNPMQEHASNGIYYFGSGALMLHYFKETIRRDIHLKGEYYVSLVYQPMLEDNKRIALFNHPHFMQWGTPQDLAEYLYWSGVFHSLADSTQQRIPHQRGTVLVPMAGAGSRFADAGYDLPKPLIPVSGKAMAVQATHDLPRAERYVFVTRQGADQQGVLQQVLCEAFPATEIVPLQAVTDGQARTCLIGLHEANIPLDQPLTIGACDNGLIYVARDFELLMKDADTDVIIWGMRRYPYAAKKPQMYGWIDLIEGTNQVRNVSVKVPLTNPAEDPIVVGAFTFKRAGDFVAAADRMIKREGRVNNEFYVDTCINDAVALGLNVKMLDVSFYLGWGTPNELKTFCYWQECFDGWDRHPYRRSLDIHLPPKAA